MPTTPKKTLDTDPSSAYLTAASTSTSESQAAPDSPLKRCKDVREGETNFTVAGCASDPSGIKLFASGGGHRFEFFLNDGDGLNSRMLLR